LSESAEKDVLSRLTILEMKMNGLDNSADILIDELESLQAVARELKMENYVDKFDEYMGEVENIKQDLSCKISDEIENEQMRKLIESRMETVPTDIENLKREYSYVRGKLAEIRDEISKK
jgi:predicted transcriptional regulator